MVRYAGQVAATLVDVPATGLASPAAFAAFAPENFVDERMLARLRRLRLPPSPRAEDATFLRQISVNLAGRLPTPDEIEAFLSQPDSPEKRRRVIARLLASDDFTDLWTLRLADLLLISGRRGGEAGAKAWQLWLREQVARNRP